MAADNRYAQDGAATVLAGTKLEPISINIDLSLIGICCGLLILNGEPWLIILLRLLHAKRSCSKWTTLRYNRRIFEIRRFRNFASGNVTGLIDVMNKKLLSERDICTKCIIPALKQAGWDEMSQIREEVGFTKSRIIVRGKLVTRGKAKRADCLRLSFMKH
jgi:hypothetical protein